ncbi:MAG: hypothetical protein SW833_21085 [Cyanobacteriota bacterium]|nr:hypothetical protein [Cyanobacteriota bacterium]
MNWQRNWSGVVLAHANHPHEKSDRASSSSHADSDAATPNPPASEASPKMITNEAIPPSLETKVNSAAEELTVLETAPNSASPTVSRPLSGLGESILALLLIGPFLLQGVKRQLHK